MMKYGFPDWMIAAIAIGVWELTAYLGHRYHIPYVRVFGYCVIGICLLVLIARYIIRWINRPADQKEPDPDEWKNY